MPKLLACAAVWAALGAKAALAAPGDPPGVQTVAPGVQVIDGAKVPSHSVDATALATLIKEKRSLRAVRKLLGGDGITSVGPGGSTVHMYKVHDTVTDKDMVAVLFVKGDEIIDQLIN